MTTTTANGTSPHVAAVPTELDALHKLAVIQREIVTLMETQEALTFAAQAMRAVGDPPERRDPQLKELARTLRLLKAYRAREAELLAALSG